MTNKESLDIDNIPDPTDYGFSNGSVSKNNTTGRSRMTFTKKLMHGLNLLGYIVTLTTYSIATYTNDGINGMTDKQLYTAHPTLLTPNYRSTKLAWGVIYFFMGLFALGQIALPKIRNSIMLEQGVKFNFFGACLSQFIWYATLAHGLMITSFVFLCGALVCTLSIIVFQYRIIRGIENSSSAADQVVPGQSIHMNKAQGGLENNPNDGYWLLRFPFGLYTGWIVAMVPFMLSLFMLSHNVDPVILVWVSVISVALLTGLSMGLLLRQQNGLPSYTTPLMISYYFCGLRFELENPADIILATYEEEYLNMMSSVTAIAAVMVLATIVARAVAIYLRDRCTKKDDGAEGDEESIGGDYVRA
jgi:hypothetical protein